MLAELHAHGFARRWMLTIALAVSVVGFELAGAAARLALRYERAGVLAGELWRLVSGNLVHLGWRHLLLNLAGLALVAALGGPALAGLRGGSIMFGSMLGVGLGLLAFAPEVGWYVGLSGALHGMLAAVVVDACFNTATRQWGVALGVLLACKLAWEQLAGPLPLTAEAAGGPVIVAAHLHGALAGALVALGSALHDRSRSRAAAQV